MSDKIKLNVAIITINDSLYAPLYIDGIIKRLSSFGMVNINCIYILNEISTGSLTRLVKKRIKLYGFVEFFLFAFLVLKTKVLGFVEPIIIIERPYSIKRLCRRRKIDCEVITSVNHPLFIKQLQKYKTNVLLSIAVGERFKCEVLDAIQYPLNVHSSLLPKYAGIMGLFWAVVNDESDAGVSVHIVTDKFDDGDILGQVRFQIRPMNSLHQMYLKAINTGAGLIASILNTLACGQVQTIPQNPEERSYFSFPSRQDCRKFYDRGFRFFRWKDLVS